MTHVIARVDDPAAGPSHSVPRLCAALAGAGVDVSLLAVEDARVAAGGRAADDRFEARRFAASAPARLVASGSMRRALLAAAAAGQVDIVHDHGLWLLPNLYAAQAARTAGRRIPLVLSPRGALSAWALRRNAWRKRLAWWSWQRRMLADTACFHATSPAEAQDIRRLGFRQPVCVIANGVDVPPPARAPVAVEAGPRTLLYLGRLHPTKGIDVLLHAWARVMHQLPAWRLRIAGPDEGGHVSLLRELAQRLDVARVDFTGPCFGADRDAAYRDAALFVLASHSENFALTVAEALAAGTPAIVTRGAPWPELPRLGAGWWIEHGVEALAATLREACALPPATLAAMGERGRRWMLDAYSWQSVGARLADVYRWLLDGGQAPASVLPDATHPGR